MKYSHILTTNASTWIDVPIGQVTNESNICLKHGEPINLWDVIPYKRRIQTKLSILEEVIKITNQSKTEEPIVLKEGTNKIHSP